MGEPINYYCSLGHLCADIRPLWGNDDPVIAKRAVQRGFGACKKSGWVVPVLILATRLLIVNFFALKLKAQLNADTYRIVILKA